MDSLSLSREITSGNKLTLFLMGFLLAGIGLLGLLACIVGIFFAIAFAAVITAVAYRMMAGLPITQPREPYTE